MVSPAPALRRSATLILCLLIAPNLDAQPGDQETSAPNPKHATAVRVGSEAIHLDGRLDEDEWRTAPAVTDFVQSEPNEGDEPTERMEVRFVYDDNAFYVGARMFSQNPSTIQAPLGRRDTVDNQSEQVFVSLDTFFDRRTAYTFGVSASGVRLDRYYPNDEEQGADSGYDPVWQAKTNVDELGWTAELWIPFTQLRFNNTTEQVWGLNIRRFMPTRDEEDNWILIPRTQRAWASRFGELHGIRGVAPTRRLELLPLVVASSTVTGNPDEANPFDNGEFIGRAGLDVKMGVGPNLTMDLTVNPDFGQVEADPAEVNLTAFATRFPEKRPFFTEGARLLNLNNHPNVFYSRRIGARPSAPASGDYVDYPLETTIITAAKLTGRLPSGTSIGVLSSMTAEEDAEIQTDGLQSTVGVNARTFFNLGKVQQEFGPAGSTFSVLFSSLHRDFSEDDPLENYLTKNAFVFGGDMLLRLKGGEYELTSTTVGSHVSGSPGSIEVLQRSSSHFMQRPDREYDTLDTTRTSLTGYSNQTRFSRISGRHWLFSGDIKLDSPLYDPTDSAQLMSADGVQPSASVTYRETRPGKIFRSYSFQFSNRNEWNFGFDRQQGSFESQTNVTWVNFWTSSFRVSKSMRSKDAIWARGGPLVGRPNGWSYNAQLGNSSSAQTRFSLNGTLSENELEGLTNRLSGSFSFRPSPRWQLSMNPLVERSVEAQQYVTTLFGGGRPETYNNRYVFARIDRSTISSQFRMGYTVRPDLNLDVYFEPFAASGRYTEYGELLAPGSMERLVYGEPGTTLQINEDGSRTVTEGGSSFKISNRDFNVRSFHSNVVLRWEWRPGSTTYVVWQQSRDIRETTGERIGLADVFRSITAPGANIFLVKMSFWMPIK
jgi:hypothetical protein